MIAPYGDQVQVLPAEAYLKIRRHPITAFARFLREKKLRLVFKRHFASGGYLAQGTMVESVLREIFPESFQDPVLGVETKTFGIMLYDSPLNHPWWFSLKKSDSWTDPGILEMSRMKAGNPMLAPASRRVVRKEFGIPESARMVHVYMNHENLNVLRSLHRASPVKPDYIVISLNKGGYLPEDVTGFEDYPFLYFSILPEKMPPKAIIFNDQYFRMLEFYTASDYAFVIGANNIFEPLRVKCPVLFFKNSSPTWMPDFRSPIDYYHPVEWARMAALAERTGGGIGISSLREAPRAIQKLVSLDRNSILPPAFTREDPGAPTPFDQLLDDLLEYIQHKLAIAAQQHSR